MVRNLRERGLEVQSFIRVLRYLDAHVRGGYQFLMQNYVCGDKICIFGTSSSALGIHPVFLDH